MWFSVSQWGSNLVKKTQQQILNSDLWHTRKLHIIHTYIYIYYREIENYIKSEKDTQIQLLSQLTRRSPQNTLGKSWRGQNLNQEFPLKKTFQTRTKKVTTKDPSEEEENKEKSPIFVEEDQRSANLKAEENTALKGIGPDWKTD